VKVSLCYADLISFGYIPRSRITESYDSSVWAFEDPTHCSP
jgi:hypothetical protein